MYIKLMLKIDLHLNKSSQQEFESKIITIMFIYIGVVKLG